ncbi:hypothetical protein N657DRAFT_384833 [Parathielavia appendiculata]|uniref:Uncharacterized protein n=1 Tax=Parathielavia appendiculata TaxID=2587402 RepID=A0AAN6Z3G5_9PEZI|nr:hypothetical protein N657DRAFT_384833 [Parathielavia appendiculata]
MWARRSAQHRLSQQRGHIEAQPRVKSRQGVASTSPHLLAQESPENTGTTNSCQGGVQTFRLSRTRQAPCSPGTQLIRLTTGPKISGLPRGQCGRRINRPTENRGGGMILFPWYRTTCCHWLSLSIMHAWAFGSWLQRMAQIVDYFRKARGKN